MLDNQLFNLVRPQYRSAGNQKPKKEPISLACLNKRFTFTHQITSTRKMFHHKADAPDGHFFWAHLSLRGIQ